VVLAQECEACFNAAAVTSAIWRGASPGSKNAGRHEPFCQFGISADLVEICSTARTASGLGCNGPERPPLGVIGGGKNVGENRSDEVGRRRSVWSGWRDLNSRPLDPQIGGDLSVRLQRAWLQQPPRSQPGVP
jgi:hypothetical protein